MSRELELNDKQLRFCEEYLIDLNGKQAAFRAGYSEKTAEVQASRLLSHAKVQEKVKELMASRSERTQVTADRILEEFAVIGFSRITDYLDVRDIMLSSKDEKGKVSKRKARSVQIFETAAILPSKVPAIAEIRQTEAGISLKLHDKVNALVMMGKHVGLFEKDNKQKSLVLKVGYGSDEDE